jgi:hypothetical protein
MSDDDNENTGRSAVFSGRCSFADKLPPKERRLYWSMCNFQDIRDGAMQDRDWATAIRAHEKMMELQELFVEVANAG